MISERPIMMGADLDGAYRYTLTRAWNLLLPQICFLLLNPSTADAVTQDATIRKCTGFAKNWGAGGILVLNLFAYRSTNPRALQGAEDPVGPRNDAVLYTELRKGPVVCGWGQSGPPRLVEQRREALRAFGFQAKCLGTTQSGEPRHPLYVPYKQELEDYKL